MPEAPIDKTPEAPRGRTPSAGQARPVAAAPGQAAGGAASTGVQAQRGGAGSSLMTELKVSGHLMTLESGLFCIVQTPSRGEPGSGLPGVRLSLAPGASGRPDAVTISGFRPDGWLSANGDAALVRVSHGPAQLLVTIYQGNGEGAAPNIQVMRLLEWGAATADAATQTAAAPAAAAQPAAPAPAQVQAPPRPNSVMEMVAHIQERGDVGAMLGEWLGDRGSKRWIEGFGLAPTSRVAPKDIEYQAVLGQGWLSPWVEGGQFCGSRAMALPLLGLRVRLRGAAAEQFDVSYSATFVDGTSVGPVSNGEACESDGLAAMEAFLVELHPQGDDTAKSRKRPAAAKPAPAPPAPKGAAGRAK
jgi:hypothetical protein